MFGVFPEGDFTHGFKTAMESRANGGYAMIRKAMKEKMGARFIARFDSRLGLYLFLRKAPKRTTSGNVDLTRNVPPMRCFGAHHSRDGRPGGD